MYLDLIHFDEQATLPAELTAFLEQDFHLLPPFSQPALEFCHLLSQTLSVQHDPDIAALGFWLRPAHINEIKKNAESKPDGCLRTPRGLAFHIASSNVDTLFVYSWIVSLLAGNGNIIRVPTKQSHAIEDILGHIRHLLSKKQLNPIAQMTCLIRYEHQRNITAIISAQADIRIAWGSNTTIETIRAIPLNPYGKELSFPDRISYSVISVDGYKHMNNLQKDRLASAFFRDAYGFDQHACSSPRMIIWVGSSDNAMNASAQFYLLLQSEIDKRNYTLPLSDILNKQTRLYAICATSPVHAINRISNELTIVPIKDIAAAPANHPGAGMFFHIVTADLIDLERCTALHDQTLTYAGFESSDILGLARLLNGRGPKRLVPFGQALQFSASWDGFDLLQELTNCITVTTTTSPDGDPI